MENILSILNQINVHFGIVILYAEILTNTFQGNQAELEKEMANQKGKSWQFEIVDIKEKKESQSQLAWEMLHDCKEMKYMRMKECSGECSCTILQNLFRYNLFGETNVQKAFTDFFITLGTYPSFKDKLVKDYIMMFNFLFKRKKPIEEMSPMWGNTPMPETKRTPMAGRSEMQEESSKLEEVGEIIMTDEMKEEKRAKTKKPRKKFAGRGRTAYSSLLHLDVQLFSSPGLILPRIEQKELGNVMEVIKDTFSDFLRSPNKSSEMYQLSFFHLHYIAEYKESILEFMGKGNYFQTLIEMGEELQYKNEYVRNKKMDEDIEKANIEAELFNKEYDLLELMIKLLGTIYAASEEKIKVLHGRIDKWLTFCMRKIIA